MEVLLIMIVAKIFEDVIWLFIRPIYACIFPTSWIQKWDLEYMDMHELSKFYPNVHKLLFQVYKHQPAHHKALSQMKFHDATIYMTAQGWFE